MVGAVILDGVGRIPVKVRGRITSVGSYMPKIGVGPSEDIIHPRVGKDERIASSGEEGGIEEQAAIVGMGGEDGNTSTHVAEAKRIAERIAGAGVEASGGVERIHPIGWLPEYTTVEGYGTVFPVEQRMVHDDAQAVG
jgi:hypothetical protein